MHLTRFSDYTLRVLLYLAVHPDRPVPSREISRAYGVSHHHLVKVVQGLIEQQLVTAARGRHGGLRLAVSPEAISIGTIVRMTEPHLNLVECFDPQTNRCPISTACGLKHVLKDAQGAFLDTLDRHTLADFLPRAPSLIRLWNPAANQRSALSRSNSM